MYNPYDANYYVTADRNGNMVKVVEDVVIPSITDKLEHMGYASKKQYAVRQARIARFTSPITARLFTEAFNKCFNPEYMVLDEYDEDP